MPLAHSTISSGPSIEMLFLAVGLFALGAMLFVQKTVKAGVPVVLILVAIAAGAGAFALGDERPHAHDSGSGSTAGAAPSGLDISIATPDDGSTIDSAEPVTIEVDVSGAELVQATTSDDPRAGHLHISVDGILASMISESTTTVELEPGRHEIEVEFTTADHRSFDPAVTDTITVTAE